MTAALATLAFLTVLWVIAVVGAVVIDGRGAKILAALRGQSISPSISTRPVRVRHQRYQPTRAIRVSARQRAAA